MIVKFENDNGYVETYENVTRIEAWETDRHNKPRLQLWNEENGREMGFVFKPENLITIEE